MTIIKELKTMDELALIQKMEQQVWEMQSIPTHQTFTAVKNGGIMLGAFIKGEIVGFSYGFAGFKGGRTYLCSHMLAVDPVHRSSKIGEKLKREQRVIATRKGYDMIQWTFDPLETRNAYLNLSKLNGVCNIYIENCYGEMTDGINKGLPSDRFEVHWYLNSPHVKACQTLNAEGALPLNTVSINGEGLPEYVEGAGKTLEAEAYSISVPIDFQHLKEKSPELALQWRLRTREKFSALFEAGYSAVYLAPYDKHAEYIFVKTKDVELGRES